MRSDQVITNFSCNQNCSWCTTRQPRDDRAFIRGGAVRARIDAALHAGAREVVFAGGEPGMRNDLHALVAHARAGGAESVALETNATLVDAARAVALRDAGLTRTRVKLPAWGEAFDHATRDPGGFERALAGLRAFVDAGVDVEVLVTVTTSTLAHAAEIPVRLAGALGEQASRVRAILVAVPSSSADPGELVSYEDAVPVLVALDAAARQVGIPVKVAPGSGPPPCVFPAASRVAQLFALTPGTRRREDHRQLDACRECQVSDRCSGLPAEYLARRPAPPMRPITEDRVRRRLSLISTVEEQVAREFVQVNRFSSPTTGEDVVEHLIRVNFHCNQACRFCFVSTHLPAPGDAAVRKAIVDACDAGNQVTLTGGEPTLNPHLVEYVRLARERTRHPIALQTNAIRLADPALTDALVAAGLGWVQVSLHGSTASLSDAITEAPGTFAKTIVGIDRLHAHTHVGISINFVITERNYSDLAPFVRFVAARWPRAFVNVSFVGAATDVVPKERALVPRYTDVLPHLSAAISEAHRLGMDIGGFESMCGIPLCLVPESDRPTSMSEIPDGYDGGEFVKTEACASCGLARKCFGVRKSYRDLYGADEIHPVHVATE